MKAPRFCFYSYRLIFASLQTQLANFLETQKQRKPRKVRISIGTLRDSLYCHIQCSTEYKW